MRDALKRLIRQQIPDHPSLAYTSWAPIDSDGRVPPTDRPQWLSAIADTLVPADYAHFYAAAAKSLAGDAVKTRTGVATSQSRLLVGHGNPSASEVGITLHRAWGVPYIPGSALKGLLEHYISIVFGRRPGETDAAREAFEGVGWDGKRIVRGPGKVHRALFGAPPADDDGEVHRGMREQGLDAAATAARVGASRGQVVFHDALYVPDSAGRKPLAPDVLTVHQKEYYNSGGTDWPNDYDSPNPVAFLTVRPGAKFLVALTGPPRLTEFAFVQLAAALAEWGVGGKTSAGYGRLLLERVGGGGPARSSAAAHNETWAGATLTFNPGRQELSATSGVKKAISAPGGAAKLLESLPDAHKDRLRKKALTVDVEVAKAGNAFRLVRIIVPRA